jgi:hypothetical protein
VGTESAAERLRLRLRAELDALLEPNGWTELEGVTPSPTTVTVLARPIAPEFLAIAEISQVLKWPDRPPIIIDDVRSGVSYEPLRRLYPLLGAY